MVKSGEMKRSEMKKQLEESGGTPQNHKDIFVFSSEINRVLLEVTERMDMRS